jgi:hypothetical protein
MGIAFRVSIGTDRIPARPSALRPFGRFYPRPRPGAGVHMSFFTPDPKTCQTNNQPTAGHGLRYPEGLRFV